MLKTCEITSKQFEITNSDLEFLTKISPTFNGKRFEIPPPTISPEERMRRRTAHRNEWSFHHNKSAMSGKPLISIYRPDSGYKVYSHDEWFSDKWDPINYGQDFNENKSFFEQLHELDKNVPKLTTTAFNNENCEFTSGTGCCKNCYLINCSEYDEDCYYGKLIQSSKNCVDCAFIYDCELMYECFYVRNGYNCKFVYYSQNVVDCWFCDDLKNCQNCFLCTNLVGKKYHFFNQALAKEEYEKRVKEFVGSFQNFESAKKLFNDLRAKRIYKYANIINSENCTGDFINNCKNCLNSFEMNDSQDCKNIQVGVNIKDCMDCSNMYIKPELSYEVLSTLETYNIHFCLNVYYSNNMWYCLNCKSCKNCFGCSGLQNQEYCILNKKYSKEEYEKLTAKIITHMQKNTEWGEYFPISMSAIPYNESVAQDYLPLSKKEIENKNFKYGQEDPFSKHQGPEYEIPDNIINVKNEITDKILTCQESGKLYKILPAELKFYKQMQVPIPRLCPNERYRLRLKNRNSFTLYNRTCTKCFKPMQSTYSPNRPEIIYCEECYLKEII